jgi:hypothetical protein
MSVEQLQKPKSSPRGDAKLVKYEEYIDRQVESTRRVVKLVDLATSLVVLAAGVLAYLLVVAAVEHWLVPGGFSELSRLGLFLLLAWGGAAFVIRRFWPLVVRRVNPVYAAHAIETAAESGPSLKNSLVNLLLFRQKRSEISDAVYHTLEEHAVGYSRRSDDVDPVRLPAGGHRRRGGIVQGLLAEGSDRGCAARADALGRHRAGQPREDSRRQTGCCHRVSWRTCRISRPRCAAWATMTAFCCDSLRPMGGPSARPRS